MHVYRTDHSDSLQGSVYSILMLLLTSRLVDIGSLGEDNSLEFQFVEDREIDYGVRGHEKATSTVQFTVQNEFGRCSRSESDGFRHCRHGITTNDVKA